jgi:ubiquinone/menaquinone biosynthesis C-methylase UbiE
LIPILKILRTSKEINQTTRENSWNDAYRSVEIEKTNKHLINNNIEGYAEYIEIINKFFINENYSAWKIAEFACGTAPLAFFFRNTYNKEIICSDYSQVIVDQLKKKYHFQTRKADISSLANFDEKYLDCIFLGGGFYEDQDPFFYKKVFNSLSRVINDNGKIFLFMNRHISLINLRIYFKSIYFTRIRFKSWRWVRKLFNKSLINYEVALYLYSSKFIKKELIKSNLKCTKINYVGHALGLCEFLKFFLKDTSIEKIQQTNFFKKLSSILKKNNFNSFSTRCVLEIEKNI